MAWIWSSAWLTLRVSCVWGKDGRVGWQERRPYPEPGAEGTFSGGVNNAHFCICARRLYSRHQCGLRRSRTILILLPKSMLSSKPATNFKIVSAETFLIDLKTPWPALQHVGHLWHLPWYLLWAKHYLQSCIQRIEVSRPPL